MYRDKNKVADELSNRAIDTPGWQGLKDMQVTLTSYCSSSIAQRYCHPAGLAQGIMFAYVIIQGQLWGCDVQQALQNARRPDVALKSLAEAPVDTRPMKRARAHPESASVLANSSFTKVQHC